MDWNDEYDNGYGDMGFASHQNNSMPDVGSSEGGFNPTDISNPVSAYLFLSDDAQEEISGRGRKTMKCLSCEHCFKGGIYDNCPKCYDVHVEEVVAGIDGETEVTESANMKCLDCYHKFVGETYDSCTECWSPNTEELEEENNDMWRDGNF